MKHQNKDKTALKTIKSDLLGLKKHFSTDKLKVLIDIICMAVKRKEEKDVVKNRIDSLIENIRNENKVITKVGRQVLDSNKLIKGKKKLNQKIIQKIIQRLSTLASMLEQDGGLDDQDNNEMKSFIKGYTEVSIEKQENPETVEKLFTTVFWNFIVDLTVKKNKKVDTLENIRFHAVHNETVKEKIESIIEKIKAAEINTTRLKKLMQEPEHKTSPVSKNPQSEQNSSQNTPLSPRWNKKSKPITRNDEEKETKKDIDSKIKMLILKLAKKLSLDKDELGYFLAFANTVKERSKNENDFYDTINEYLKQESETDQQALISLENWILQKMITLGKGETLEDGILKENDDKKATQVLKNLESTMNTYSGDIEDDDKELLTTFKVLITAKKTEISDIKKTQEVFSAVWFFLNNLNKTYEAGWRAANKLYNYLTGENKEVFKNLITTLYKLISSVEYSDEELACLIGKHKQNRVEKKLFLNKKTEEMKKTVETIFMLLKANSKSLKEGALDGHIALVVREFINSYNEAITSGPLVLIDPDSAQNIPPETIFYSAIVNGCWKTFDLLINSKSEWGKITNYNKKLVHPLGAYYKGHGNVLHFLVTEYKKHIDNRNDAVKDKLINYVKHITRINDQGCSLYVSDRETSENILHCMLKARYSKEYIFSVLDLGSNKEFEKIINNQGQEDGNTALHIIAEKYLTATDDQKQELAAIAKRICEDLGADKDIRNKAGKTPFDILREADLDNNSTLCKLLRPEINRCLSKLWFNISMKEIRELVEQAKKDDRSSNTNSLNLSQRLSSQTKNTVEDSKNNRNTNSSVDELINFVDTNLMKNQNISTYKDVVENIAISIKLDGEEKAKGHINETLQELQDLEKDIISLKSEVKPPSALGKLIKAKIYKVLGLISKANDFSEIENILNSGKGILLTPFAMKGLNRGNKGLIIDCLIKKTTELVNNNSKNIEPALKSLERILEEKENHCDFIKMYFHEKNGVRRLVNTIFLLFTLKQSITNHNIRNTKNPVNIDIDKQIASVMKRFTMCCKKDSITLDFDSYKMGVVNKNDTAKTFFSEAIITGCWQTFAQLMTSGIKCKDITNFIYQASVPIHPLGACYKKTGYVLNSLITKYKPYIDNSKENENNLASVDKLLLYIQQMKKCKCSLNVTNPGTGKSTLVCIKQAGYGEGFTSMFAGSLPLHKTGSHKMSPFHTPKRQDTKKNKGIFSSSNTRRNKTIENTTRRLFTPKQKTPETPVLNTPEKNDKENENDQTLENM